MTRHAGACTRASWRRNLFSRCVICDTISRAGYIALDVATRPGRALVKRMDPLELTRSPQLLDISASP